MISRLAIVAVLITFIPAPAPATAAQADGTLSGIIRDITGGSIPGAAVTATNQTTKASRTTSNSTA